MTGVGRRPDDEAGRILMQTLEASTLTKRQPWYRDALAGFVVQQLISQEQALAIESLIGLPIEDIFHLETPYDKAQKAGILTRWQADVMDRYIFELAHSGTALCSGTAAYHFDKGVTTLTDAEFRTDQRDENVVKVSGGAVLRLRNVTIEKRGDTTDHSEGSFTGLNAAILAEGGQIVLEDSTVTSHAIGGNNVFAHGENSQIILKNVLLDAYGAASNRCVYVSFGGTLEAEGCEFVSRGSISSTVATDTGGGTIRLKNCLVKTLGGHCASLYSTGYIEAEHCICVAPETEGLIIVGGNTMELRDSCVFSGQGQGVKLTAAMEECAGTFTMTGGSLTVCEGPVISAERGAEITLRKVNIANPSGEAVVGRKAFAPPGVVQPPQPPALLHVVLQDQVLQGSIISDEQHVLKIDLEEGSRFTGCINPNGTAQAMVRLSADSRWELTGDSILAELINEDPTGSNIVRNGYILQISVDIP